MKRLLLLLISLSPSLCFSQSILKFNYTEVCSEEQRQIVLNINPNNSNTYSFFGESKTFTPLEIQQGDPLIWLAGVYRKWTEYYPCAEIREIVTDAIKNSSEKANVDVDVPIVIVASDFGYRNSSFLTSGGFNSTDLLTSESEGFVFNASTSKIGNIGFYRSKPTTKYLKTLTNANILFVNKNLLGNITSGIIYSKKPTSSFFLHSYVFGNLNGYRFQDNSVILGTSNNLLKTRVLSFGTTFVASYTYRVKVFKLDYWFEDYMTISSYFNMTYSVTQTFGLNLSYTNTLRTNSENRINGILLGGRVFF